MINDHTEMLLTTRERYLAALQQRATLGIHTPPYISVDIAQTEAEIAQLRRQRTQQIPQPQTLASARPALAQGLILLISPQRPGERLDELASYQAIAFHQRRLTHAWLIASSGSGGSLPTAQAQAQHFGSYGIQFTIWQVLDPTHADETFALVDRIYTTDLAEAGLDPDAVIADITGGSKPMTAGMVLACGSRRAMQYMVFQPQGPSLPVSLRVQSP